MKAVTLEQPLNLLLNKQLAFCHTQLEKGEIDTKPWITHRTSLEEMIDMFPACPLPESRVTKRW